MKTSEDVNRDDDTSNTSSYKSGKQQGWSGLQVNLMNKQVKEDNVG